MQLRIVPCCNEKPSFSSKTDIEVIKKLPRCSQGSADLVGIRLELSKEIIDSLPDELVEELAFTANGCFTKKKWVATVLIRNYNAVLIR